MTLLDRDADDPAASRLDGVATDNLIRLPVGALHQDVRLDRANHLGWGVLGEHRDRIDASECQEELGAFALRCHRPSFSLVAANGLVRVHTDNQRVAKRPGLP